MERAREYQRRDRARRKAAVLSAYGSVCTCCGESEPSFLVIDHVNNDGARHREEIGQGARKIGSGSIMHKWLMANDYPAGFQILCANCNMAKHSLGVCPHAARV